MKFNLSEANLSILTDTKCLKDSRTLENIISKIEGTSISHFKQVYECISQFYLDNDKKFPSKEYLTEKFPRTCVFSGLEAKPTSDLVMYFFVELKKENIRYLATEALLQGDLDAVADIVGSRKGNEIENIDYSLYSIVDDYIAQKEIGPGVMSGIEEIDSIVEGFGYGTVTTIAGGAGSGKTTVARSLAYNASYFDGKNVAFITMEISRKDMKAIIASRHSKTMGIPILGKDVIKGTLEEVIKPGTPKNKKDEIMAKVKENAKKLELIAKDFEETKKGVLYVIEENDIKDWTFAGFERHLECVDERMTKETGHGIDIIILDYIQLVKPAGMSKNMEINTYRNLFIQYFRSLCVSFNGRQLIGILLAQVNRTGMSKQNSSSESTNGKIVATYSDIAELNSIERESSNIIVIYSNTSLRMSGILQAQVIKNRIGLSMECMVPVVADYKHNAVGGSISVKRDIITAGVLDSKEFSNAFLEEFDTVDAEFATNDEDPF